MSYSWWAELLSALAVLLALSACWMLLSEKGKILIATRHWIPACISILALALTALHLTLTH